jgi:signal transduction histidine kinase
MMVNNGEKRNNEDSELMAYSLLAQTAVDLVDFESVGDIYAYTAKKINQLLKGESIVTVVEYNLEANRWTMQHVEGLGNRTRELSKLFGFDVMKLDGEVFSGNYEKIVSGKLTGFEPDFPGLLNNKVTDAVGKAVKKIFSIDKLYCIAFQQKREVYGNITFTVNSKTGPVNAALIEAFVCQVSIFLKKFHAEAELKESNRRLEFFLQVSQSMNSTLEKKRLMQMIVDNAVEVTGFDGGAIYLLKGQKKITLEATFPALPSDFPEKFRTASLNKHPHVEKAIKTCIPVVMADSSEISLTPAEKEIVQLRNLRSNLYLPIHLRGITIGVLILSAIGRKYQFSEDETSLLEGFASQAAQIINNISNYDKLKKYATVLERQIIRRKQTEKELVAAKEKAEESDRLQSAFLANMSHEIRTPMNGILGFSKLLKRPELSGAEQQKYIGIIEKSGVRMLNIINDIIDISRIQSGMMTLKMEKTNLNEQFEFIYSFFHPEATSRGIQLFLKDLVPVEDAVIYTDREKVAAILTNLVKNAIKYTEKGFIEFGFQKRDAVMGHLVFYVRDTGIGIPKERQEAIFERFIQADIADQQARQGAGLGLAITKAYIDMLGGSIWVESEEELGSTFWLTLPRDGRV